MSKNFISYTNLDYDGIRDALVNRLSQDSRFSNFSESSFYAILTEIFSATTDFTNYYLERRAEESYLDSAKLRSSVSLLSRMLGYSIRRPIPARTQIKITIKTLPQGIAIGQQLIIPAHTSFYVGSDEFFTPISLFYTVTLDDINFFNDVPGYFKELNYYSIKEGEEGKMYADNEFENTNLIKPITLLQGSIKSYTIEASTNNQANTRYQKYTINDKTFSNYFGSEDLGYDIKNNTYDFQSNMTRVRFSDDREFEIDRKTLTPAKAISQNTYMDAGKDIKFCLIRTNVDDSVEICFGDDIVSSIGVRSNNNSTDSLTITYLSTKGASANMMGVVGRFIEPQENVLGYFTKTNIEIQLTKNITGGLDIEEVDSIKVNAPSNFSSMERCVTAKDYISFLKTLTYGSEEILNAIAWGEQEEHNENGIANIKLFNVVLFTFLTDLYEKNNGLYVGAKGDEVILGTNTNDQLNDYFNIVVKSDSTTPLKRTNITNLSLLNPDLNLIYDKLDTRSEISVKSVYISPLLRDFNLEGNIYINPLVDKDSLTKKITNALYSYLSKNIDFRVSIYLSNLVDIIESFPEVKYTDVKLSSDTSLVYNKFYTTTSGSECIDVKNDIPSGAPRSTAIWFYQQDIGYVFKSSIVNKQTAKEIEYSTGLVKTLPELYLQSFGDIFSTSAYSNETLTGLSQVMPQKMNMILTKEDSEFAKYMLVWNNNYYGTNDFYATERNITLGLLKDVYEFIKATIDGNKTNTKVVDEFIALNCPCVIDRDPITQNNPLANVNKDELQYFLDNDFFFVVKAFREAFIKEVNTNLLDSFGNIKNYTMRNEVPKVNCNNPLTLKYIYIK